MLSTSVFDDEGVLTSSDIIVDAPVTFRGPTGLDLFGYDPVEGLVDANGNPITGGGGTIGGTIANTRVAFGTGVDTIGGDAFFTFNSTAKSVSLGDTQTIGASSKSLAVGEINTITGTDCGVFGKQNSVAGTYNFAAGQTNVIGNTTRSAALGNNNNIGANSSDCMVLGFGNTIAAASVDNFIFGSDNSVQGSGNTVVGGNCVSGASSINALAIGNYLNIGSSNYGVVIGDGVNSANKLTLTASDALFVGFNSTIPTLVVTTAGGVGTLGKVGIGTSSPGVLLDVAGAARSSTTITVDGGTGKTLVATNAAAAPSTSTIFTGTDYYGGNGKLLGDPVAWMLIKVGGTERKCPLY